MVIRILLLLLLAVCFHPVSHGQSAMLYISDAGNYNLPPWQILRFNEDGSNGDVFISSLSPHLEWPQDILFLERDTVMLVSNLNSGEIVRFNANTGAYMDVFASGIGGPTRMKIGKDSLLYVLQWSGNRKVWRYRLDGTFVDQFTATGVETSIGLAWDEEDNLYVSSYNGKFVKKFSPTGADLGKIISTNLDGPTNIWFDGNGDFLVNDYNGGAIKRFGSDGTYKGVFISGVPLCEGVGFRSNGNLMVGSGGTSSVNEYNPAGALVNNLVPSGTLGLLTPNAVVLRSSSMLSTITTPSTAVDAQIVIPSIGIYFQFTNSNVATANPDIQITNASGTIMERRNTSDSTYWDASYLPDGIYYLTLPLKDHRIARQQVVVMH